VKTVFKYGWQQKKVRLLLVVTLLLTAGCQRSFFYNCRDAGEIEPEKKSAIAAVSLQFAQAALRGDVDTAYNQFTEAAKANTSRDQLTGILQAFKSAGPYDDLQVERIMVVTG
jgi:hypothetical protein